MLRSSVLWDRGQLSHGSAGVREGEGPLRSSGSVWQHAGDRQRYQPVAEEPRVRPG